MADVNKIKDTFLASEDLLSISGSLLNLDETAIKKAR